MAKGRTPAGSALVGREREWRLVVEAVDRVARGAGGALLISGEAGIGKTSLGQQAMRWAAQRGFHSLSGRCQPLERNLGYAPIIQAFGAWLRKQPGAQRSELTRGLASLSSLFEGLDLPAPGALGDAALERTRLFEAVTRLLGRIASQAPAVALFDDLHWADPGSLELLLYMSHDLSALPVLWIVTYRAGEPAALQRRFRALRDSMLRPTTSRELHLDRLDADDVRALLITRLGGDPSPELVDMITKRSQGVPLFVDALVRWLLDTGRTVEEKGRLQLSSAAPAGLPTVIRDVIAGRLERLSKTERETLELIAVAGEARRDVLERVASPHLDTGLSSLLRTGLVVEETGETTVAYRLEHPLVLEVAYEEMPLPRRRRLHLDLAEALERLGDVSAQAIHYLAAGPAHAGRALDVLLAAGQDSLNRYADEQAARFFQAALPRAERSRPDLVERLLIGLGEASFRLGRLSEATRLWRSLLEGGFGARDRVGRTRIHRLIAAAESERGAYDAAERELQAGLASLDGVPPCEERLELLFLQGVTAARRRDGEAVLRAGRLIVEEGTHVETPRARVLTGIARGEAHLHSGQHTLAAKAYEDVAGMAEALRDPALLRFVHGHRGTFAAAVGDLAALRLANERSLDLGPRVGVPGWDYRLYGNQFLEAFLSGEWDRAWEVCREARMASEKVDNPRTVPAVFAVEAILAAFKGNLQEADDRIRIGRSFLAQYGPAIAAPAAISLDVATALVALERGDPGTAVAVLEPVESPAVGSHLDAFLPPWGLVALAEARAKSSPFAAAWKLISRLRGLGPEGTYPAVIADRLLGLTKLSSGRAGEAIGDLLRSRDGFRRLGMPFESVRATIEASEAMAPKSRHHLVDLADEISAAHQLAVRLGARRYEERAAVLLRTVGAPVPARDASPEAELTPRQLEVARLVAKGLSNAEIAEHLFVSVRTVTSHLDHVYTRLGIDSRAALATYVTERRYASQLAPSGARIT